MGKIAEQHAAAASMAGFTFQIDRALERLALSKPGDQIGLETLDDVVVQTGDGGLLLEQDKLSFVGNPITNRSSNLWKTIGIWVDLLQAGECDLDTTQFVMVTNQRVESSIASILKQPPGERAVLDLIRSIRENIANPAETWKRYASTIGKLDDAMMGAVLERVWVVDTAPFGGQEEANEHFANLFLLTSDTTADIVQGMRGWLLTLLEVTIHQRVQTNPSTTDAPGWVSVEQFREQLNRLKARFYDDRLMLRAAEEIVITQSDRDGVVSERFVQQLRLIEFDKENAEDFIDAITDFLRSKDERTRLAVQNGVTQKVFRQYQDQLTAHWKLQRREALRSTASDLIKGQTILDRCLAFNPQLDGNDIGEGYLPRGTYHTLANLQQSGVGWHPLFSLMLDERPS